MRTRLTLVYGALFLVSGVALLAITNVLVGHATQGVIFSGQGPACAVVGQHAKQPHSGTASLRAPGGAPANPDPGQCTTEIVRQHAAEMHQLLVQSGIALAIMTLVSVCLGWLVAGRVLRPLRVMTAATRRISSDNLHERLPVTGPADELRGLGETINDLLERLEDSFDAQRLFVANASHELRTPLTTMRAMLDVAAAKPGPQAPQTVALSGKLRSELDLLDRLLEGLLVLARASRGTLTDGGTTLSLHAVVAAALNARREAITALDLTAAHHAEPAQAWVHGSATLLSRMAGNLLDNAIRHNERGGWIEIRTATDGQVARLTVENGGQLIDRHQAAAFLQPFRRLRADRTGSAAGSGLGLSIVAAVGAAHGGDVEIEARAGGGLRVTVTLPLAAAVAELAGATA